MSNVVSFEDRKSEKIFSKCLGFVEAVLQARNPAPLPYLLSIGASAEGLAQKKGDLLAAFAQEPIRYWNFEFDNEQSQQFFLSQPGLCHYRYDENRQRTPNPDLMPFPWVMAELAPHLPHTSYVKFIYGEGNRSVVVTHHALYPEQLEHQHASEQIVAKNWLGADMARRGYHNHGIVLDCNVNNAFAAVPLLQNICNRLDPSFSVLYHEYNQEQTAREGCAFTPQEFVKLRLEEVLALELEVARRQTTPYLVPVEK